MMNKKGWQEWEDIENRVDEGNVLPEFLFSAIHSSTRRTTTTLVSGS